MQTSTLVILLTGIIAMLVVLVSFLCWRMVRKNDELRHKNRVIVQELERNQPLIERAVSHGVSRAALLMALPMLLGLASCTDDNDDNPVINPDEPQQQQLADYTIIWYGHGGGNLDLSLTDNMMQFYMADADSYDNVKIAAQYKYSALEGMEETFDDFAEALAERVEPGTADYDEAMQELEAFKAMYYPMAGKTTRFVVDMEHFMEFGDDADDALMTPDMSSVLPGDNADIDALGAQIKTFTDRLVDAYQNGGDEVRAKIDKVTANAYRVNEQIPAYDLIDYVVNLTFVLPDVFGSLIDNPLGQAFDRSIVYQQSSRWLQENDGTVDLSVLLGCQGHYTLDEGFMQMRFDADGTAYPIFYTGLSEEDAEPRGSTLDATYGQLRFDRLTGWSRWLRLNQQEPNPDCATGYNPFDRRKRK